MQGLTLKGASMRKTGRFLALLCILTSLAACGGGGGGGGGGSDSSTPGSSGSAPSSNPNSNSSNPSANTRQQTVNLSWTPPSARADGTPLPLSELSGYKVYVVKESDSGQDKTQVVSGGSATSAQMALTAPGTYTVALTAMDQNGQESALSNAVTLTLK